MKGTTGKKSDTRCLVEACWAFLVSSGIDAANTFVASVPAFLAAEFLLPHLFLPEGS